MSKKNNYASKTVPGNFMIVWLDSNDTYYNEDVTNSINIFRDIVNSIETFTDTNECVDFLTDIENEKVLMIISCSLFEYIASRIEDIPQLHSIYTYCTHQEKHKKSAKECTKLKGRFTGMEQICDILKRDVRRFELDLIPISIISMDSSTNLDELDQSFMYPQLLKEIILEIEYDEKAKHEFTDFICRDYAENAVQSNIIRRFSYDYELHTSIWWYSKESFIYSTLNKALRTQDIEVIIKMGFFMKDLHQQIEQIHLEAHHNGKLILYRGQGISNVDFTKIQKCIGGLFSFNNFLSTSIDPELSRMFADSARDNFDMVGVLFQIKIDSSISSIPFASLDNISHFKSEEEILFSMHTIFRIVDIQEIDVRLWQVNLTLTSDNDEQLKYLTDHIRNEIGDGVGWHRMGILLTKMGKFHQAVEIYNILIQIISKSEGNEKDSIQWLAPIYSNLAGIYEALGEYSTSLFYCEKTIEIHEKSLPICYQGQACTFNHIALLYEAMGDHSKALSYYEKILEIHEMFLSLNDSTLAIIYNNIGALYRFMKDYSTALLYYEMTLKIQQTLLPLNHPELARTYNNIGDIQKLKGDHLNALANYEITLEILRKSAPPDHPEVAATHNNIGSLHRSMENYSAALRHFKKALEIGHKSLPPNHPSLAKTLHNIAEVYNSEGDYPTALSYHKMALEIQEKSLPFNHPDLILTYNNMAGVHYSIGDYSNSVSYLERALEIQKKSLPLDYPSLATSFNNIGGVCYSIGDFSTAFSYFEKALEIRKQFLPPDHPKLADAYSNVGMMYRSKGDYSTALLYLHKVVEIQQICFPLDHPTLATTFSNIGLMYYYMRKYWTALSYYEKALVIEQNSLPPDHPELADTCNIIGEVLRSMGEYSTAFVYFEKTLEIRQKFLPDNHIWLLITYGKLAVAFNDLCKHMKTIKDAEQVNDIICRTFGPDHPKTKENQRYLHQFRTRLTTRMIE
jgi:tetratricopeptide (TPR) repeat protein